MNSTGGGGMVYAQQNSESSLNALLGTHSR